MGDQQPTSASEWATLGQGQLQAGRMDEAIASFARATELEPDGARYWLRLGRALATTWQYGPAEAALRKAAGLDGAQAALQLALSEVLLQQNKAEEAIEACARAVAAEPDNIPAAVSEALLLPPVYSSTDELQMWRDRFTDGLDRLRARQGDWMTRPQGVLGVETTNFYLAYQGENDRALQSSYGDFLHRLLRSAVREVTVPITRRRDPAARIRVGFLSANLRASTIGDYFGSWITELPRERFEVASILAAGIPDGRTEWLAAASDRYLAANGSAIDIARAVKALELDVLVFLDVGMTPWSSLFANMRLAPVQCAAWGHPVTTGGVCIDNFISCTDMELPDAESHYRERLLLLPGLGTRYTPPPRADGATRERFSLPSGRRLYLCPQSLFKIHPDSDALFFDLLARDEDAILLFFAATTEGQRSAFVRRLEDGMKARNLPQRQQIKLLPRMSHRDFRGVMTVCDVMLDTLHWSGGGTSLDALAAGLPIITLPGRFMRGRQSAAMLRIVGVEELIARDESHYVDLALRVARDAAWRAELSSRIRAGLPRLIDRREPIDALATALEKF